MMLLLDTHVLVWLDEGSTRLGKTALQIINESLATGQLGVATISFWEIAMLIEKQRLVMKTELDVWRSGCKPACSKFLCEAQRPSVPVNSSCSTVIRPTA